MADRIPLVVDSSSQQIKELPAGDSLILSDSEKVILGTGSDLQIYHDGNNSFIDEKESGYEGNVCVCGCNKCKMLYKLYHTKTKNAFMVGSSCIVKGDHLEFIGDMICAEKNGRCKECNIPLRYKGVRKNSKKKYNGFCEDCRVEVVIFLKISYAEKDQYKSFGTRWNPKLKCWYWKGYEIDFPKILKPKYWYKNDN